MANRGLDNKISNIIGTKLPQWLIQQFDVRANRNADDVRSNENLLYLANKSAWVRLVSSVDIIEQRDRDYFKQITGLSLPNPSSLSKNFVLFGGTSKYKKNNSYELKSGVSFAGTNKTEGTAYGTLGKQEIQDYGYRPMPGIISVTIETQGRLGSVRAAIINFKCWDKQQLDIIDALYFKLGFTMFLEWGHTYFYTSDDPTKLKATEDYAIVDPFRSDQVTAAAKSNFPTKEEILSQISESIRQSEGNYDGMLGIVTNFNFSYNQEGGYDCTLRLMSLGMLGDSIKINNPATLPTLLTEQVLLLDKTLKELNNTDDQTPPPSDDKKDDDYSDAIPNDLLQWLALNKIINYDFEKTSYRNTGYKTYSDILNTNDKLFNTIAFTNWNELSRIGLRDFNSLVRKMTSIEDAFIFAPSNFNRKVKDTSGKINFLLSSKEYYNLDYFANNRYVIGKKNIVLFSDSAYKNISLDFSYLKRRYSKFISDSNTQLRDPGLNDTSIVFKNDLDLGLLGYRESDASTIRFSVGYKSPTYDEFGVGSGDLKSYPATYFFTIAINRIKKSSIGTNLTTATDNEIYQALLDILSSDVLSNVEFSKTPTEEVATPFRNINDKFSVVKNTKLKNIINDNLPYYFNVKFKQKLNNKLIIKETSPSSQDTSNLSYEEQLRISRQTEAQKEKTTSIEKAIDVFLDVTVSFNDTSLFYSIETDNVVNKLQNEDTIKSKLSSQDIENQINKQEEEIDKKALLDQVQQSLSFQSALELTLRTIEVYALNRAIYQDSNNPDENIANKVFVLEIAKDKEFLKSIFSNGLFTPFIDSLVSKSSEIISQSELVDASPEKRLEIYSKYGFLSSLLGNKSDLNEINSLKGNVDFNKLLTAFVLPYRINQELVSGISTNHPVYIPLGFLLMLLNHICTIYDSRANYSLQTPLVYIDFNPELNFFLTNNQQLSVDPFKILIPFEGSNQDYQQLFYDEVLNADKTGILAYKDSKQSIPLFKPEQDDLISFKLQEYCPIKLGKIIDEQGAYRGRLMNILISIDYLTDTIRDYSRKDGSNNVYLQPFLEDLLTTINKCLGNFNSFRLSYNDSSNTFQIVDDQVVPTLGNEIMLQPNPAIINRTEIPLIGKNSIAKTLETRTEISSKLGSFLAISANPKMSDKSTLSTNGDSIGFLNTEFVDRYITNRLAIGENVKETERDSRISEAIMFNSTITDFYSSANPSDADVSQVTSYYIEKMSKVKNQNTASLAAAMVPIGINFSTDGISGFNMGQAFTVSDKLLPYSYTAQYRPGYIDNYSNYVGFAIVGLTNTIESNQWNTSVRTNMIAVKDKTSFIANPVTKLPPKEDRVFSETNSTVNPNSKINVNWLSAQLNIAIPFFKNTLKFDDIATAAAIGNLIQESGLNYQAWNIGETVGQVTTIEAGSSRRDVLTDPVKLTFTGKSNSGKTFTNRGVTAYGIAQWTQTRKERYIEFRDKNGGDSLQTQLKFLKLELDTAYKATVLDKMKLKNNLTSAVSIWLKNYEGIEADLQNRVSYANGVLEYIKLKGL